MSTTLGNFNSYQKVTMNAVVLTLCLCVAVVVSDFVDYRVANNHAFKKRASSEFICPGKGSFCKGCDTIVSCTGFNSTAKVVMVCTKPALCNDELTPNPTCSTGSNRKCSELGTFKCADYGTFPDPSICNKFHFCVSKATCGQSTTTLGPSVVDNPSSRFIPKEVSCPANYQYNILTSLCDKALSLNQCPRGQFPFRLCQYPGEKFQISGALYAECLQDPTGSDVLYPYQYYCRNGKPFSTSTGSC